PHFGGAVALPVGDPAGIVGCDDPHREVLGGDPAPQLGLERLDLRGHPRVTDAVTKVAHHSPGRPVALVRILPQQPRRRDRLRVLPWLPRCPVAHRRPLPLVWTMSDSTETPNLSQNIIRRWFRCPSDLDADVP